MTDPSENKPKARIAVAVSGSGRSLANLLRQAEIYGSFTIEGVIASRPDCYGVTIARERGLPLFIDSFNSEEVQDMAPRLEAWLSSLAIDWIALAGFLKRFPVLNGWHHRIVNIHPALLPQFGGRGMYGHHVHEAVLAHGMPTSGATIHFVNERYDEGAIIAQIQVPVAQYDTAETLAARVFEAECHLYPYVMDQLVRGHLPRPDGTILRLDMDQDFTPLKTLFEETLRDFVTKAYPADGSPLNKALAYALAGEGKRVRPLLALLTAEALGADPRLALPGALAVEMVHTYSLVHDDLPCMDNDDLRRGRPTVHKVFGDAEALLVGDALLTDAFHLLALPGDYELKAVPEPARLSMVAELARAAGSRGMVQGQSQDLYWTQRQGGTTLELDHIHRDKTGRLLGAATAMGALAGGGSPYQVTQFRLFGEHLGLAFQITDDLLDESDETGKSKGKDLASGKLTYVSQLGRDKAMAAAEATTRAALEALAATDTRLDRLKALALQLLKRKN